MRFAYRPIFSDRCTVDDMTIRHLYWMFCTSLLIGFLTTGLLHRFRKGEADSHRLQGVATDQSADSRVWWPWPWILSRYPVCPLCVWTVDLSLGCEDIECRPVAVMHHRVKRLTWFGAHLYISTPLSVYVFLSTPHSNNFCSNCQYVSSCLLNTPQIFAPIISMHLLVYSILHKFLLNCLCISSCLLHTPPIFSPIVSVFLLVYSMLRQFVDPVTSIHLLVCSILRQFLLSLSVNIFLSTPCFKYFCSNCQYVFFCLLHTPPIFAPIVSMYLIVYSILQLSVHVFMSTPYSNNVCSNCQYISSVPLLCIMFSSSCGFRSLCWSWLNSQLWS